MFLIYTGNEVASTVENLYPVSDILQVNVDCLNSLRVLAYEMERKPIHKILTSAVIQRTFLTSPVPSPRESLVIYVLAGADEAIKRIETLWESFQRKHHVCSCST